MPSTPPFMDFSSYAPSVWYGDARVSNRCTPGSLARQPLRRRASTRRDVAFAAPLASRQRKVLAHLPLESRVDVCNVVSNERRFLDIKSY